MSYKVIAIFIVIVATMLIFTGCATKKGSVSQYSQNQYNTQFMEVINRETVDVEIVGLKMIKEDIQEMRGTLSVRIEHNTPVIYFREVGGSEVFTATANSEAELNTYSKGQEIQAVKTTYEDGIVEYSLLY